MVPMHMAWKLLVAVVVSLMVWQTMVLSTSSTPKDSAIGPLLPTLATIWNGPWSSGLHAASAPPATAAAATATRANMAGGKRRRGEGEKRAEKPMKRPRSALGSGNRF